MSKRLQVLLEEEEFDELRAAALSEGVPVSEWVRTALHEAKRRKPAGDIGSKLSAVRAAARHEFPTAGVEQMLAEIEQGYPTSLPE
jgi:hypothetical protein